MQHPNPFNWPVEGDHAAQVKKMALAQAEEAKPIFNVFSTPEGQKALAVLKARFLDPPVAVPSEKAEWSTQYAYFRGGQQDVIRTIMMLMEFAQNHGKAVSAQAPHP